MHLAHDFYLAEQPLITKDVEEDKPPNLGQIFVGGTRLWRLSRRRFGLGAAVAAQAS